MGKDNFSSKLDLREQAEKNAETVEEVEIIPTEVLIADAIAEFNRLCDEIDAEMDAATAPLTE